MSDKALADAGREAADPRLNTRRAARYMRRDKRTLYNLVWSKEIEPEKGANGRLLFPRSVLDRFLAERGEAPGTLEGE
jgi:hypothetical protein